MTGQNRRVLITGAGGYLGGTLARALLDAGGFEIIVLERRRRASVHAIRTFTIDLTEQCALTALLRDVRPEMILHAAGQVHGTPTELFRENSAATVVLVEAVLAACPDAIVTALGSAAEYGRPPPGKHLREDAPLCPVGIYGHTKAAASRYLLAASARGLRHNLVRVFNPVGVENSPDQVLGAFIGKLVRSRSEPAPRLVSMGPLGSIRDFIVVDDLATLIVRLLADGQSGQLVNACSGKGHRVRDLVHRVLKLSKLEVELIEEEAAVSASGYDAVIGDPTQFISLSGLERLSSVEDTLDAAWFKATASTGVAW